MQINPVTVKKRYLIARHRPKYKDSDAQQHELYEI
jgi:hypothetical protein